MYICKTAMSVSSGCLVHLAFVAWRFFWWVFKVGRGRGRVQHNPQREDLSTLEEITCLLSFLAIKIEFLRHWEFN